ncbi:unnamed protein product, partial [Ectocarpus sp. 12 AP-2014]
PPFCWPGKRSKHRAETTPVPPPPPSPPPRSVQLPSLHPPSPRRRPFRLGWRRRHPGRRHCRSRSRNRNPRNRCCCYCSTTTTTRLPRGPGGCDTAAATSSARAPTTGWRL